MPLEHLVELVHAVPAALAHALPATAAHLVSSFAHALPATAAHLVSSFADHSLVDHAHVGKEPDAGAPMPAYDPAVEALSGGKVRIDLLNNNNSQYYGDFTLGTPGQRFTAVFDTGSGITWIPGAKCRGDTCDEHHRYETGSSGSFRVRGDSPTGSINYGTGQVKYDGGHDTLTLCDSHEHAGCHGPAEKLLRIPGQPFGMSTHQTSYPFRILPFDGILGLAPSASKGSVLHQLKAAKALDRNVVGVYLSEDTHRSGSMDFGGVEPAHIAPHSPLHWHKIRSSKEWTLGLKDILVDGKPLHACDARPGGVCPAVVDTGSSLVTGPRREIQGLLSKIHTDEGCGNLRKMPVVSFQLVDQHGRTVEYPLTPEEYTLRTLEEVPNTGDDTRFREFAVLGQKAKAPEVKSRCDPGIGVMDVPGNKWVIGDTFLRRYYSIYDDDKGLVGFVRSIHPDEAPAAAAPVAAPRTAESAAAAALGWLAAPRLAGRCRRSRRARCSPASGTRFL